MEALWFFDFVSPFAYLQLRKILALRTRIAITPMPIVFGALLKHHGQLGPAEIPAKRAFTYRFVQWQAARDDIPLRFPPAHPFNPLAALRLCITAGEDWAATEAIFEHLWRDGCNGESAEALSGVARKLGIADTAAVAADSVKTKLRANTQAAISAGVFGVPTLQIGSELFWGYDATAMIEDALADDARFSNGEYARLAELPHGVQRKR